jgi:Bestrophin, RFP-TM, chloride channel
MVVRTMRSFRSSGRRERRRSLKTRVDIITWTTTIADPLPSHNALAPASKDGQERKVTIFQHHFVDANLPAFKTTVIMKTGGGAIIRASASRPNNPLDTSHHRRRLKRPFSRLICTTAIFKLYFLWMYTLSNPCHGLVSSSSTKISIHRRGADKVRLPLFPSKTGMSSPTISTVGSHARAYSSPLFVGHQHSRIRQPAQPFRKSSGGRPSSTALPMVLTTPESIIEQASTINLLDDLIDESVRTSARRPIMMQFDPSSGWIWRRWTGTIFSETWTSCVRNMVYALCIFLIQRSYPCINKNLSGFGTLWGQLLSVTTFTLTFFVNQSYSLWRKCMELSRRLQGRLHDINMNLASHAARKVPSNPNEKSTYTASSRQILELMSRYVRLFNLLTYASFTRSHRPILTPRGMRRLVERGLMTATEREVLVDAAIPATQRHSVVLMWMIRLYVEGRDAGHIQGGAGFEQETMNKFHIIRSQYGAIGDELQGRMPLAYAHIVQVLVDLILWMFPIMAFSTGMSPLLVIVGTGLLTISYQGLFDLAKQFLDPYDNENYGRGEDPLCVDTLIAETNAGSVRWLYGFEEMPYSAQRVRDGEMYDYLLPVRGYSVEELAQMEEERIEREKQLEEQRKREEEEAAERLRREAEEMENAEDTEDVELVDDGIEVQTMQELIEELSMEPLAAVQSTNTTAKSKERRKRSRSVDVAANKTITSREGDSQVIADVVLTQNMTSAIVKEKGANKTASKTTKEETTSRTVHKVTTLASGKPVKFTQTGSSTKEVVEEPVPSNTQATNYLATLSKGKMKKKPVNAGSGSFVPELIEYQSFDELPWFNETGPDGQEIRMSQRLAEEVWPEETSDIETKTMTWDEYQERRKEAENELQETFEILSASPGADGNEKLYTVTERKKKASPTYDQTRLDSISQLWGLPPEDPSALGEYEPPEKIDDIEFEAVSQLWGGSVSSKSGGSSKSKTKESEVVGIDSFAGISELWGNTLDEFRDTGANIDTEKPTRDSRDPGIEEDQIGSYAGLPWHNEKGKDGKEYRLSQMLADEEWSTEGAPPEKKAMTLEDYNKQVEEILTQAEEEMRETEAILLSKPGTDPLGWDYDEEKLVPMSEDGDEPGEDKMTAGNVTLVEDVGDDLTVLAMDDDDDDDDDEETKSANGDVVEEEKKLVDDVTIPTNGDAEGPALEIPEPDETTDTEESQDDEILEEEAILKSRPGEDPVGWDYDEDKLSPMGQATEVEVKEGKEDSSGEISGSDIDEETTASTKTDDIISNDGAAKGSDIIQPIFFDAEQVMPDATSKTDKQE